LLARVSSYAGWIDATMRLQPVSWMFEQINCFSSRFKSYGNWKLIAKPR
jgi:hypothetical protein